MINTKKDRYNGFKLNTNTALEITTGQAASKNQQQLLAAWQYLVDERVLTHLNTWFVNTAEGFIRSGYIKARS
jgi:hypothetical protein